MFDLLRHFFADARPIDWVMLIVELLVLLLIAYEVIWEPWKSRRLAITALNLADSGEAIRQCAPGISADENAVNTWTESVNHWVSESCEALEERSAHAASSFRSPPSRNSSSYIGIHQIANDPFGSLLQRIEILRSIAEKASLYR
jgi:hypothetical protein